MTPPPPNGYTHAGCACLGITAGLLFGFFVPPWAVLAGYLAAAALGIALVCVGAGRRRRLLDPAP